MLESATRMSPSLVTATPCGLVNSPLPRPLYLYLHIYNLISTIYLLPIASTRSSSRRLRAEPREL